MTGSGQPTDRVTLIPSTDEGSGTTTDSTTNVTPTSSKAIDLKDQTEEPSFLSTTVVAEATEEALIATTMEGSGTPSSPSIEILSTTSTIPPKNESTTLPIMTATTFESIIVTDELSKMTTIKSEATSLGMDTSRKSPSLIKEDRTTISTETVGATDEMTRTVLPTEETTVIPSTDEGSGTMTSFDRQTSSSDSTSPITSMSPERIDLKDQTEEPGFLSTTHIAKTTGADQTATRGPVFETTVEGSGIPSSPSHIVDYWTSVTPTSSTFGTENLITSYSKDLSTMTKPPLTDVSLSGVTSEGGGITATTTSKRNDFNETTSSFIVLNKTSTAETTGSKQKATEGPQSRTTMEASGFSSSPKIEIVPTTSTFSTEKESIPISTVEATTIESTTVTDESSQTTTIKTEATSSGTDTTPKSPSLIKEDKTTPSTQTDSATDEMTGTGEPTNEVTLLPSTDEGSGTMKDSSTAATPTSSKVTDLKDQTEEPSFLSTSTLPEATGTDKIVTDESMFETTMEGSGTPSSPSIEIRSTTSTFTPKKESTQIPTMTATTIESIIATDELSQTTTIKSEATSSVIDKTPKSPSLIKEDKTTASTQTEMSGTGQPTEEVTILPSTEGSETTDSTTAVTPTSSKVIDLKDQTEESSFFSTTATPEVTTADKSVTDEPLFETTMEGSGIPSSASIEILSTTSAFTPEKEITPIPIMTTTTIESIKVSDELSKTTTIKSETTSLGMDTTPKSPSLIKEDKTTASTQTVAATDGMSGTGQPTEEVTLIPSTDERSTPMKVIDLKDQTEAPSFLTTTRIAEATETDKTATDEPLFETTMEGSGIPSSASIEILSTTSTFTSEKESTHIPTVTAKPVESIIVTNELSQTTTIKSEAKSSGTDTTPKSPSLIKEDKTTVSTETDSTTDEMSGTGQPTEEVTILPSTEGSETTDYSGTKQPTVEVTITKEPFVETTAEGSGFISTPEIEIFDTTLSPIMEKSTTPTPSFEITSAKTSILTVDMHSTPTIQDATISGVVMTTVKLPNLLQHNATSITTVTERTTAGYSANEMTDTKQPTVTLTLPQSTNEGSGTITTLDIHTNLDTVSKTTVTPLSSKVIDLKEETESRGFIPTTSPTASTGVGDISPDGLLFTTAVEGSGRSSSPTDEALSTTSTFTTAEEGTSKVSQATSKEATSLTTMEITSSRSTVSVEGISSKTPVGQKETTSEMDTTDSKSTEFVHLNKTTILPGMKEIVTTLAVGETVGMQQTTVEVTGEPLSDLTKESGGIFTTSIFSTTTRATPSETVTVGDVLPTTRYDDERTVSEIVTIPAKSPEIIDMNTTTSGSAAKEIMSTSDSPKESGVTKHPMEITTTEAVTMASKRAPEQLIASDAPDFIMTTVMDSRQDATDEPIFPTTMEGSGLMTSPSNKILSTKSAPVSTGKVTLSSMVNDSTTPVVVKTDSSSMAPFENETESSKTVTNRPRDPAMIQSNGTTDSDAKDTVPTSNTPDKLMTTLQQVDETEYQSTSAEGGITSSSSLGELNPSTTATSTTNLPTLEITSEGSGISSPSTLNIPSTEEVAPSAEPEVTEYKTVEIIDSSDEPMSTAPSAGMTTDMLPEEQQLNDTSTVIGSTDIKSTSISIQESTVATSTPSIGDAVMNTDKMYTEDLKDKETNVTAPELSLLSTNIPIDEFTVEGSGMMSPESTDLLSSTPTLSRRGPEQLIASEEPGFIMTTIMDSRQDPTYEPYFETSMEGSGMMSSPFSEILSTKSAPVSTGQMTPSSMVDYSTAAVVVMTDFPSKAPFENKTTSSEMVTSRPRDPGMIQLNRTTDSDANETVATSSTPDELMTTLQHVDETVYQSTPSKIDATVTSKPSSTWFTVMTELEASTAKSKTMTTDSHSSKTQTTMETSPSASVKLLTSLESQRTVIADDSKVTELQEPSTGSPDIESNKRTGVVELISESSTSRPTTDEIISSVTVSSVQDDKVTTSPSTTSSTSPITHSTLKEGARDHTVTNPSASSSRAASTLWKIITHPRTPSSMVSEQTNIPQNITSANEPATSTPETTVIGMISEGMNYITNLTMTTFGGIFTTAQPSDQTEVSSTVETKSALSRIIEMASTSRTKTMTTEELFSTEDGSGKEVITSSGRGQPSTTVFSLIRTQRTEDLTSKTEETDKQTDRLRIPSTPPPPPPYPPMITTLQPPPVDIITTTSSPPPPPPLPPTTPPPPPPPPVSSSALSPMDGLPSTKGTPKLPVALVATTEVVRERTMEPDAASGDNLEGDSIAATPESVNLNLPGFMARIRECGKCGTEICPVCGTNGFTYQSECILNQTACLRRIVDLEVAYQGECINGFLELVKGDISCHEFECPVTYNPVCGSDNQTYTNSCELQKATLCSEGGTNIEKISDGICKTNS